MSLFLSISQAELLFCPPPRVSVLQRSASEANKSLLLAALFCIICDWEERSEAWWPEMHQKHCLAPEQRDVNQAVADTQTATSAVYIMQVLPVQIWWIMLSSSFFSAWFPLTLGYVHMPTGGISVKGSCVQVVAKASKNSSVRSFTETVQSLVHSKHTHINYLKQASLIGNSWVDDFTLLSMKHKPSSH